MKVAAVALVLAVASPALDAQGVPQQDARAQSGVFTSTAALVALNVTVQDKSAKYVAGLQIQDFVVYEDGVRQEVRFFEARAVPLDLIVLIDTSSSMRDRMDIVHDAAAGFVSSLREGDRGAVLSFADRVSILEPLTSDRAALAKAVRSTGASGSTSLNNAVYVALKEFGGEARTAGAVRRQAIVVLSDGTDTASLITLDDVLALARKSGVSIYTVGLQPVREARGPVNRDHFESDAAMKALARETGAQAFFPEPTQLKSVYRSIAAEVASQYSIGYVPANTAGDGRFRRVSVQVVTKPDLRPRTRLGYSDGVGR